MSMTFEWRIIIAVLLVSTLPLEAMAQTLEEVRQAVLTQMDGEHDKAARARLAGWGAAALPHLTQLAREGVSSRDELSLVHAIGSIRTREARELLIEILSGDTRVTREKAMRAHHYRGPAWRNYAGDEKFRAAVLFFLQHPPSELVLTETCEVCKLMGWSGAVPLVRELLRDRRHSIREVAQETLQALTGEPQPDLRVPRVFPGVRLRPDLFEPAVRVQRGHSGAAFASFTTWLDGRPCLIVGSGDQAQVLDHELKPVRSLSFDRTILSVTTLPGASPGTATFICKSGSYQFASDTHLVAYDVDLEPVWEYKPASSWIPCLTVLPGSEPEQLRIAVGSRVGSIGIVLLDRSGQVRTRIGDPFTFSLYCEPRRPDLWLQVGGRVRLFEAERGHMRPLHVAMGLPGALDAVLLPGADPPGLLATTMDFTGDGIIVRSDTWDSPTWSARITGAPVGMVRLDPEGHLSVFVCATARGELLAFLADGTLIFARDCFAAQRTSRRPHVIDGFTGGPVGEGRWAIALTHRGEAHCYPLDTHQLPFTPR